jgi:hypothetical protein
MASFSFAASRNTNYVDWEGSATTNASYTSYMYTFHQVADDPMFHFQTPYVYFYLQPQSPNDDVSPISRDVTTNGLEIITDDALNTVTIDEYATATESCLFRGAWNWTTGDGPSKFSRQEEIYQYRNTTTVTPVRKKVRGNGKVLQMRFESGSTAITTNYGKGFSIFGWGISIGKNSGP